MNLKTTSGAAADPKTSVLILSFGLALWYRVACICLQISLADFVLSSKAIRFKRGGYPGERTEIRHRHWGDRCFEKRENSSEGDGLVKNWQSIDCDEDTKKGKHSARWHKSTGIKVQNSRLNLMSTVFTYRNSCVLASLVNLIGMLSYLQLC